MAALGYILGYLIVGVQILVLLAGFAILYKVGKILWKTSDSKSDGKVHDGWADGTWYDAGSDGGN